MPPKAARIARLEDRARPVAEAELRRRVRGLSDADLVAVAGFLRRVRRTGLPLDPDNPAFEEEKTRVEKVAYDRVWGTIKEPLRAATKDGKTVDMSLLERIGLLPLMRAALSKRQARELTLSKEDE